MGWSKHEDAVKYYQKGLTTSHRALENLLDSPRSTPAHARKIAKNLRTYVVCCCVNAGGVNEELEALAVERILEILPELTFPVGG